MKIVVIGGSGLIGSKLVEKLRERGHDPLAASPDSSVDTLTGAGVQEALQGADVVVDVSNSPSFADDDVMAFFRTSTGNLTEAAMEAGVAHYVALSIVGTDRLPDSGYLRAKAAQEEAVKAATVSCTIVRATQFFEFAGGIADGATEDGVVRLPGAGVQPIAADDVAPREVVTDPQARYFGAVPGQGSLLPSPGAQLAQTRLADWLAQRPGRSTRHA